MEKKNIDWSSLGFGYVQTDYRYVSKFKDGAWDAGELTTDPNVTLNECAGVFQYAQTVFEGMKAYTTEDGHIVTFRPDLNAERMANSAKRLEMPVFPEDRFVDAIVQTVKANAAYVPPYGSGATLYVRPYMMGTNPVIGVKPADEYMFRVFTTPVGPYFKGGAKPITIRVSDFDRAAPHGTGHIKAGLNYAMSLHAIVDAHKNGFDENMYLDAATRTKVEETGGANFIFVTKDGKVVTPKSNSILPSITRRSLIYVAKEYLGLEAEEREIYFDEVKDFAECGLCGTAAILTARKTGLQRNETRCSPVDYSIRQTAWAAIPSPEPVKPRRSSVVALTLMFPRPVCSAPAIFRRICSICGASFGRWAMMVASRLPRRYPAPSSLRLTSRSSSMLSAPR